jgi:predicted transcriptional regulator
MMMSRRMRWSQHVTCVRVKRNTYRILVEKLEGKRKRPLERPRCMYDVNINMKLR